MEAPFKDRNGADAVTTAAWSIVKLGQVRSEQVAADTIVRSGDATIYISLPFVAGDTTAETIRRARNLAGTVADQMRAQLGGTGKLAFATFDPQTPILAAEVGAADGNTETAIDVAWRETP